MFESSIKELRKQILTVSAIQGCSQHDSSEELRGDWLSVFYLLCLTCSQLLVFNVCLVFHLFIHPGYFYSTSSSPLLLRGAPNTARIRCRSSRRSATGNCEQRPCPRS